MSIEHKTTLSNAHNGPASVIVACKCNTRQEAKFLGLGRWKYQGRYPLFRPTQYIEADGLEIGILSHATGRINWTGEAADLTCISPSDDFKAWADSVGLKTITPKHHAITWQLARKAHCSEAVVRGIMDQARPVTIPELLSLPNVAPEACVDAVLGCANISKSALDNFRNECYIQGKGLTLAPNLRTVRAVFAAVSHASEKYHLSRYCQFTDWGKLRVAELCE